MIEQVNKFRAEGLTLGMPAVLAALALVIGTSFGAGAWFKSNSFDIATNKANIAANKMVLEDNAKEMKASLSEIKGMLARAGADRWCATNMREWSSRAQSLNPNWRAPAIDDLRSFPCLPPRSELELPNQAAEYK